jgi:hypothetical protein
MLHRPVPPHVWIAIAGLSSVCAVIRYFGLSAVAYTLCYGFLTALGLIAALWMTLVRSDHRDGRSVLFILAFAPLCLLFIDLTSAARIICLISISVAALSSLRHRSPLAGNGS